MALMFVSLSGCGDGATLSPGMIDATTAGAALSRTARCGAGVAVGHDRIVVTPSGGEDTANLQCALDAAIETPRPMTVQLAAGEFFTAQLVAKGFAGTLRGAGRDRTVIKNAKRPLPVTFLDHFLVGEPSAANPWPTLLAFVDGDFRVSDLTISVLDEEPTVGWSLTGLDLTIKALAQEIVILGDSARAAFERVAFVGSTAPSDPIFGMNVYNAVYFEGLLPGLAPLSGAFEVRDCAFVDVLAGAVITNVRDTRVAFVGNTSTGTPYPSFLGDLDRSDVLIAGNVFDGGLAGVQIVDECQGGQSVCGLHATRLAIAGNRLTGFDGVEIFATFGDGVRCAVTGNQIHYDVAHNGVAVWLGSGTRDCLVVTTGAVRDEGVGNHVIRPRAKDG